MAEVTLDRLAEGIRRANAKGDTETVKKLGAAYRALQGTSAAKPGEAEAQTQEPAVPDTPPAGAVPGSGEYAKWAMDRVKAGLPVPQVSPKPPEAQDPNTDLGAKAIALSSSMINGVPIVGGELLKGAENLRSAVHGMPLEDVQKEGRAVREANPVTSAVGGITGSALSLAPLGATQVGGRLLGTVGSLGQRVLAGAGSGAALSGADTLARGGSLQDATVNAGLGGALGAALPLGGAALRKVVSPIAANPTKAAAAKILEKEGVDLTAGQATGNRNLQFREAELGGNAARDFTEKQAGQFTSAALRKAGITADKATHDVIDNAFSTIGQKFDALAARSDVPVDQQMQDDLITIVSNYLDTAGTPAPGVERMMSRIGELAGKNGNILQGDAYQNIRSKLGEMIKSADGPTKMALRDMQEAVDDAVERNLSPQLRDAWRAVRTQYRNLLVIEDAATRAGANSAEGLITPAALRSAALRQNKRAFARGRNDFVDLADAGVSAMTPLPDSGTAGRLTAKALLPAGAIAGASLGSSAGPVGTVLGGIAGAAVPWAVGKALLSKGGRAYLKNQSGAALRLPGAAPALVPLNVLRKREPVEITVRGGAN